MGFVQSYMSIIGVCLALLYVTITGYFVKILWKYFVMGTFLERKRFRIKDSLHTCKNKIHWKYNIFYKTEYIENNVFTILCTFLGVKWIWLEVKSEVCNCKISNINVKHLYINNDISIKCGYVWLGGCRI